MQAVAIRHHIISWEFVLGKFWVSGWIKKKKKKTLNPLLKHGKKNYKETIHQKSLIFFFVCLSALNIYIINFILKKKKKKRFVMVLMVVMVAWIITVWLDIHLNNCLHSTLLCVWFNLFHVFFVTNVAIATLKHLIGVIVTIYQF